MHKSSSVSTDKKRPDVDLLQVELLVADQHKSIDQQINRSTKRNSEEKMNE